jgi:hypothetical protein
MPNMAGSIRAVRDTLPNASLTELVCWPYGRVHGGAAPYVAVMSIGSAEHLGEIVTDL